MKQLLIALTLIASTSAFANCMNLSGTYKVSANNCNYSIDQSHASIWSPVMVKDGATFTVEQYGCEQLEITSESEELYRYGSWNHGVTLTEDVGKKGIYVKSKEERFSFPFDKVGPKVTHIRKLTLDRNGNLVAKSQRGRVFSTDWKCTFKRVK